MTCGNKEADVGAGSIGNFAVAFNATESLAFSINSISADTDTVTGYLASGLDNAALESGNITYDGLVFVNDRAVGKNYAKAGPAGAYHAARRQSKAKLLSAFYDYGAKRNDRTDGRGIPIHYGGVVQDKGDLDAFVVVDGAVKPDYAERILFRRGGNTPCDSVSYVRNIASGLGITYRDTVRQNFADKSRSADYR